MTNNIAYLVVILCLIGWYLFLFFFGGFKFMKHKNNIFIKNIKKKIVLQQNFNNLANEDKNDVEDYPVVGNKVIKAIENDNNDWDDVLKNIEEQQSIISNSNEINNLLDDIGIDKE
jgi:hypothetical protein